MDTLNFDGYGPGHVVTKENIALLIRADGWQKYRKQVPTRAIRIDGPFRVATSESPNEPFYCEDGWLAIDARGYPYAIADEEFRLIYEPDDGTPAGPAPRELTQEERDSDMLRVVALEQLRSIASDDDAEDGARITAASLLLNATAPPHMPGAAGLMALLGTRA